MTIKFKYDSEADRMRLLVEQIKGENGIFWLRRNQCLTLLNSLEDVARKMKVKVTQAKEITAPIPKPPKDLLIDSATPEVLKGLRLGLKGDTVILQMAGTEKGATIQFDAEGLKQFHEIVAIQAERAGWDAVAGTKRLRAMAKAREVIKKSKSLDSN